MHLPHTKRQLSVRTVPQTTPPGEQVVGTVGVGVGGIGVAVGTTRVGDGVIVTAIVGVSTPEGATVGVVLVAGVGVGITTTAPSTFTFDTPIVVDPGQ